MYGHKYSFRNPLKQNMAHIRALQEILNLSRDKFISIVVFSQHSTIKVNTSQNVIYTSDLLRVIRQYHLEAHIHIILVVRFLRNKS